MPPQAYNFFGLGGGQMAPSQDPALLAQQMQLQQYDNPTQSAPSQGAGGSINPQALAKMLMPQQQQSPVGVPSDSISWNTGAGPLPWLSQNQLPWLAGGA